MLTVSHHAEELEGVQTDVVIQAYADQILVLITQLGKVGNLVRIRPQNKTCDITPTNAGYIDTGNHARRSTLTASRALHRSIRAADAIPFTVHTAHSPTRPSAI